MKGLLVKQLLPDQLSLAEIWKTYWHNAEADMKLNYKFVLRE